MPHQAQANLAALLESTEDLIWSVDLSFGLITFNGALQKTCAKSFGRHVKKGMLPGEMLPEEIAVKWPPLYRRALSEGAFRVEYPMADGRILELSLNPIVTDGAPTGISVFGKDITEEKLAELRLRESESALRQAELLGTLGRYVLDIDTRSWTSSQVMDEIFGIGTDYDRSIEGWATLVHPDEAMSLRAYFFEEVLGHREDFNRQYRIVRQNDHAVRWVHGIGRLHLDAEGNPVKMFGIVRDITESKLGEIQLRDSEERYRATFDQAAVGIVTHPSKAQSCAVTLVLQKLWGIRRQKCRGCRCKRSRHRKTAPKPRASCTRL